MPWTAIWQLFLKDGRRLAPWVALFACALALDPNLLGPSSNRFGWIWGESEAILAPLAFAFLIVMLMQQENAVSPKAYWLSRPFSRSGLLVEKSLFIFAAVLTVVFVYQIAVLQAAGLPIASNLHSLLWREFFLFVSFAMPCAALGAVSKNLAQAVMLAFAALAGPILIVTTAGDGQEGGPAQPDWISITILLFALCAASGSALAAQYVWRATATARALLAMGPLLGFGIAGLLPLPAQLAVQTWTSRNPAAASQVRISWDTERDYARVIAVRGVNPAIDIPIRIEGVPEGSHLLLKLIKPSAKMALSAWSPDWMDGQIRHIEGHEAWLQLPVPSDTSAAMRNATVLMQATLYLTLVREIGRLEPRDLTSIRTTPKCKPGYSGPCGPVTEDTALTYATIGEQPLDLDLWYGRLPAPFPVEFPGSFTPLDSQTWPAPGGNNSYSKTLELVMEMPEAYFRLEMPPQRIKFAQPGEFFRPQ